MESNLSISEFKELLKSTVKIGNPKIKLSPFTILTMFGESSKTFFGVFDDKSFFLTTNFGLFQRNSTPYILRGSYKTVNGKLTVKYILEPRFKYQKVWWILLAVFGIGFFNYTLSSSKSATETNLFYIMNSFLIFMLCFGFWNITNNRKRLEKNFMMIFKITN